MSILKVINKSVNQSRLKVSNAKRMKKRNNKRVGIVVTKHYNLKKQIKDMIYMLKENFGNNVEIISTAENESYDRLVKTYALEFELAYKEFIPAHKQKTLYSAMGASYYGKDYSVKNFFIRDNAMAKYIDYLIVFYDNKDKDERENLIKIVEKLQKKVIIIT